jgi:cytochrome c-type biogenesis protein
MISIPSLGAAFLAGLVTFVAPCTLPLVPAYLGFLSGVITPADARRSRGRILTAAVLLVAGFSVVFVIFGSLVGLVGSTARDAALARLWIQRVGGVIIIVLGLSMLGVLRIPALQRTLRLRAPRLGRLPMGPRAFLFGVILASGWTPCVGPILGTILFLAASTATVTAGALLLTAFSVGLALPFLLVAVFYGQAARAIARLSRVTRTIEVVAGAFLVFLGYLFVTDRMAAFIASAYRLLDFIQYDALYRFF